MAHLKVSANGKADRSSSAEEILSDTDLRQDVEAIKEDVVRLAQHLQESHQHLMKDAKKTLDSQMKKAKRFSRDSMKQMETHVREKPAQSVLVAFGAGLLASFFLGRR